MSNLLRLNLSDVTRGLVVAVFAGVVTYLAGVVNVPGWDFSQLDWQYMLKIAVTAMIAYLGKNFISDSNGRVLGKIG